MQSEIKALQRIIDESERIAFFGGAGVSTESGIPDFRSVDGLYAQRYKYPPEHMLSHSFYETNPEEFFAFYREKMLGYSAAPNPAHLKLAELEAAGKRVAVITQNIDGLHTAAGSQHVIELHGCVERNYCLRCGALYGARHVAESPGPPLCAVCGGPVKPDVVLYGEPLSQAAISAAVAAIAGADALIIGGTSLVVYPAAGLVEYYHGDKLVVINRQPGPMDGRANLLIQGSIGAVLGSI